MTDERYFFAFNSLKNGLERYCYPSCVKIIDDRIYFNNNIGLGRIYTLFKLDIDEVVPKAYPHPFKPELYGYHLIILYCAFIITRLRKYLNIKYPDVDLIFQFGIPIDHLSDNRDPGSKEEIFRRAYAIAEILSRKNLIAEGLNIAQAVGYIKEAEEEYKLIPQGQNRTEIYPETMAGIASLLKDYQLPDNCRYTIVDIGAGTTDISFFEFSHKTDVSGKFHVYNSKTLSVGAENKTDTNIAKKTIADIYKNGFGKSYYLCPKKWKDNFSLLFLGGGSRTELKDFTRHLELTVPGYNGLRNVVEPIRTNFPRPNDVADSHDITNDSWKDIIDFLAISYGLSTPNYVMPKYNPKVPPIEKRSSEAAPFEPVTPDVG